MYDKFPWEMGYPYLEEFVNMMPFIATEVNKRRKESKESDTDFEKIKHGRDKKPTSFGD